MPKWLLAVLVVVGVASLASPIVATVLNVTGMTFVGSRGSTREVVLHSREAVFRAEEGVAELLEVEAEVSIHHDEGPSFTMFCDEAVLNLETNDFVARGHVHGVTRDGQRYRAPWVEYVHEGGVLSTTAPVVKEDDSGSFSGDGFRYHVRERRFHLLGNVRVEQVP